MKFINLNFIFNLTTLFIILLISFTSNSLQLPDPKLCEDQGEYTNDENTSLYCVVCNTDYNKDAFLSLYDDIKIIYLDENDDSEYETNIFPKSEIEKDRSMKSFCKTGEMIPIGTLYIEPELQPEVKPSNDNQSSNEENKDQENIGEDIPVKNSSTNSLEETNARVQIQEDLNKIIQIVDMYNEINKNIYLLSFNSRENTKSFIERYLEILEKDNYSGSFTDINKQIDKLENFFKRKNEANDIYRKLLYNCGPLSVKGGLNFKAKFSEDPNDTCRSFLKGSSKDDAKSNEDNFNKAFNFLTKYNGYLDKNNSNVPIVPELIKFFKIKLKEATNENEVNKKNAEEFKEFTKEIQRYLAELGYLNINQIDGDYGPATERATNEWREERANSNITGKIERDSDEFKLLKKHSKAAKERKETERQYEPKIKDFLKYLGYKTSKNQISKSIKKFQKKYGFEATGSFFDKNDIFNIELFNELENVYQDKRSKDKEIKSQIPNIQTYLQLLGFYNGNIDGDLGSGTKKAIKKWEKNQDTGNLIKEDGSLNKDVLKKLKNQYDDTDKEVEAIKKKLNHERKNFDNLNNDLTTYDKEVINLINEIVSFETTFVVNSILPQLGDIEEVNELDETRNKLNILKDEISLFDQSLDNILRKINELSIVDINNNYIENYKNIKKINSKFARNILYDEFAKELDFDEFEIQKNSNLSKLNDNKTILNDYLSQIDTKQKALDNKEEELESSLPLILIVAGAIVLIAGGILLFIFNRNQSSKKQLEQSERELRERQARIEREELEQENLRLKENIAKQAQQGTLAKDDEVQELTQEEKEERSKTHIIQDYYNAVLDVSNVDEFKEKWEAIGLKEDQVIDHSKNRTLSIDDRSFSKANFWAVPWKNDYYIFAGRTLSKNAAALIANDYQWANELFEGIFTITDGDQFMTKARAIASRSGDVFTITEVGVVQIPKNN